MTHAGLFVPLTADTHKRLVRHLGGFSQDCDEAELYAFVFGTAKEFWEHAYLYDGDIEHVVDMFELKAEIARDIAGGINVRFVRADNPTE